MSEADVIRFKRSLQTRVLELLQKELPTGWECRMEGEHLVLVKISTDGKQEERPLSLKKLYDQIEKQPEMRREALYSFVTYILANIRGQVEKVDLQGKENSVYPVLRHRTFLEQSKKNYVTHVHTAETIIAYALDLGDTYVLLEEQMIIAAGWHEDDLIKYAMQNLKNLPFAVKTQQVGENMIYFISPTDGYAASRILLSELLEQYAQRKKGDTLGVAIPHQDVLIIADLFGERGAQLLSRLTYDFATKGQVPISPLPFIYQDGVLEPYIVISH